MSGEEEWLGEGSGEEWCEEEWGFGEEGGEEDGEEGELGEWWGEGRREVEWWGGTFAVQFYTTIYLPLLNKTISIL